MRKTMSRFLVLPFYMGCLDQSTTCGFKNTKVESNQVTRMEGESSSIVEIKKSWSFVAPSRSNISKVMDKVIRVALKSFTQIFAYKDIEDIESETKMEIGFPTDVKHVMHIGHDGTMTTNPDKNYDHLQPPETLSIPSVSLKQFELAMAAQVERHDI